MKLKIDPVPETCSKQDLRELLPCADWAKLSRRVSRNAKGRCEICGERGPLFVRELWRYSKRTCTRKVRSLRALCNKCYQATYLGFECRLPASEERLQANILIEHFLQVNGVSVSWLIRHRKRVQETWSERCRHEWRTDLGIWDYLIERAGRSESRPAS